MAIITRLLTVTRGNINNNHLYLKQVLDLFPADTLGGANSSQAALRTLRVLWGSEAVDTDIDRSKNIFRRRSWVARFFKESCIQAGDRVVLEQLEPYLYRVSKAGTRSYTAPPFGPAIQGPGPLTAPVAISADSRNLPPAGPLPRRATLERSVRDGIVRRDRFTCQACGRRTKGQVHHILPLGRGGPDTPANLVTLCGRCHMLVSPIAVEVLCNRLRIGVEELLAQKAKVEVAVHSWVLTHSESANPAAVGAEELPRHGVADSVPARSGFGTAAPEWKQLRPRAGKAWTRDEDAALLREFDAGLPLGEIACRR